MTPRLTEDEIDDLNYFARAGETADLEEKLTALAEREGVSPAEILSSSRDESKATCLHKATGNGHLETTRALMACFSSRPEAEKKDFLDAANDFGNTGLHWAALGGHLAVVKLLVENGANPGLANDGNYVPLDLASFGEKGGVVDYFLGTMDKMEGGNAARGGLEKGVDGVGIDDGDDANEDPKSSAVKGFTST